MHVNCASPLLGDQVSWGVEYSGQIAAHDYWPYGPGGAVPLRGLAHLCVRPLTHTSRDSTLSMCVCLNVSMCVCAPASTNSIAVTSNRPSAYRDALNENVHQDVYREIRYFCIYQIRSRKLICSEYSSDFYLKGGELKYMIMNLLI